MSEPVSTEERRARNAEHGLTVVSETAHPPNSSELRDFLQTAREVPDKD